MRPLYHAHVTVKFLSLAALIGPIAGRGNSFRTQSTGFQKGHAGQRRSGE